MVPKKINFFVKIFKNGIDNSKKLCKMEICIPD